MKFITFKSFLPSLVALFTFLSGTNAEFIHPGEYHNLADLAFMREKIEAKAEPWSSAWEQLQSESYSSLTWTPHPEADWDANKNSYLQGDALAAYSHALQWALTGKQEHADKAIEILNAWSSSLQNIHGTVSEESGRDQGRVQMELGNYVFLCEVAWKQGVDLYGAENNLLRGLEYTARYMLGNDGVPFTKLPPLPGKVISEKYRGRYAAYLRSRLSALRLPQRS